MPNDQPRPPREHPLWPAFEEKAKERLGAEFMWAMFWEFFLYGAQAIRKQEADDAVKHKAECLASMRSESSASMRTPTPGDPIRAAPLTRRKTTEDIE